MKIVENKNLLMRDNTEKKHEIRVDPDDPDLVMEVWIREISFLDIQRAAQEMFDVAKDGQMSLNLEGYWKYAFSTWITKTNPNLSNDELLNLTGYIGEQIAAVLPNPEQLGQMMSGGFTKDEKR
tara:strand:+ start:354 stop:725 length:372 start_codon:yes stop_codon:yes gene_type:complete